MDELRKSSFSAFSQKNLAVERSAKKILKNTESLSKKLCANINKNNQYLTKTLSIFNKFTRNKGKEQIELENNLLNNLNNSLKAINEQKDTKDIYSNAKFLHAKINDLTLAIKKLKN